MPRNQNRTQSILIIGRVSESIEEPDPRLRSILIIGRASVEYPGLRIFEPVEELEPELRWILTKDRVSESLKDLGLGRA